jgi:nitrous oxide reductase accessory protein NosL
MTTGTGRPTARRASTWLVVGLIVPVALAGCSRANHDNTPDPEAARQFAQCMRDSGVADFPDPDANGQFRGQGHEQQNDLTFTAAMEKCRSQAPAGEHERTGDPAVVEQMRQYSQCMRDNGVTDFPDPDADGRLRGEGHEQRGDPTFKAASAACRSKLPGGGSHG